MSYVMSTNIYKETITTHLTLSNISETVPKSSQENRGNSKSRPRRHTHTRHYQIQAKNKLKFIIQGHSHGI